MKCPYKYFLFIVLPISMACAQGDNSTNSAAASSLIISGDRTQEERITFLLDVAQAYVNEGDIIATIDAYERILEIDPKNLQARRVVGHAYISAKQYKKAETMLLALTEEYPEDFKLWNNLAWLYATAEDLSIRDGKKATQYAQEAMTLAPNDYHVWSTLSEAHYISGEYEKAYRAVMHMASLAARFGTGITEENVNEYNEQIRKCKRAIDTEEAMKPEDDSSTE
jgi:tetratricopeptide (TPR) repeat protein